MNALTAPTALSLFIATVKILDFQMIALSAFIPDNERKYDWSRFTSQEAWEGYTDIIVPRKLLPERNVVMYHIEFDEFKEELMRRHWDEELTSFDEGSIDVAIVKEFYANLYDLEDKLPKQLQVRGHLIKFDEDTLNTFRKTAMIVEEGENLCAYSRFALLRPNPQELAAKLCLFGELVVNPRTFFGFCCKDWGSCGDLRFVPVTYIQVFDLGNQIELPGRKLTVDSRSSSIPS
ncbi:hypothetical protein JHK85_010445 [Glycine max]|nr:hypothetical protein JHK85_010445 [Glycine max]